MKTKVHIISGCYAETLEPCINYFIKDKEVVDIKFTSVLVYNSDGSTAVCDRALIIYKETENEKETVDIS